MARRGHRTGIISTYHHTWLLKTDGLDQVWISDAVPKERQGDASHASVTEVRHVVTDTSLPLRQS